MEKMPFRDAEEIVDVDAVIAAARRSRRATGGRRCRCSRDRW